MVVFDSAAHYIESCAGLQAKVTAIDAIIDALLITAARMASGDEISEYALNDGQTQIKTAYKGADKVYQSIAAFERLKQIYVNRLDGRILRLVDGKNFTGYTSGHR